MDQHQMALNDPEVVEVRVIRKGNLEETTFVAWKTEDGTAINGQNFIGGSGMISYLSPFMRIDILAARTEFIPFVSSFRKVLCTTCSSLSFLVFHEPENEITSGLNRIEISAWKRCLIFCGMNQTSPQLLK